jgi:hypothetical protein
MGIQRIAAFEYNPVELLEKKIKTFKAVFADECC